MQCLNIRLLCSIISIFLVAINLAFAVPAPKIDNLIQIRNQEIQRLLSERKDTLGVIVKLKENEWQVLEVLKVLENNIEVSLDKIEQFKENIGVVKRSIRITKQQVSDYQVEIDRDKKEIDNQIQAMFYVNKVRDLTPILGLGKLKSYFRNKWLLVENAKLDINLLNRLLKNYEQLQKKENQLLTQKNNLNTLIQDEETQRELLKFEQDQQYTYLRHIKKDRILRLKYLREIQVGMERLNDIIYSLEIKKEREEKSKSFKGFRRQRRKLPAPIEKGRLVLRFGQSSSPFHTLFKRGVLVESHKNIDVRAILEGKVVFAGPFKGYQNLVILDHGKGCFSVYGKLKNLYVSVDDVIDQKNAVGSIYFDNSEKKHLLYFETRINRKAVNPMQWLARNKWR